MALKTAEWSSEAKPQPFKSRAVLHLPLFFTCALPKRLSICFSNDISSLSDLTRYVVPNWILLMTCNIVILLAEHRVFVHDFCFPNAWFNVNLSFMFHRLFNALLPNKTDDVSMVGCFVARNLFRLGDCVIVLTGYDMNTT